MVLRDSIWIRTTPEDIVRFFNDMDTNYTRWHPDHLRFEWVEGRGVKEGVGFAFDERIGGKLMKKTVVFTRVVDGKHMEFAPTSRLLRLILPRLLFRIRQVGEGCEFTAEIHIRTGPVGAWLNRKEFNAVRKHMREEGENLKRLLEGAGVGSTQR